MAVHIEAYMQRFTWVLNIQQASEHIIPQSPSMSTALGNMAAHHHLSQVDNRRPLELFDIMTLQRQPSQASEIASFNTYPHPKQQPILERLSP